jgi:divalent metal cation (Fe/Co/Zn/Cd) transporter
MQIAIPVERSSLTRFAWLSIAAAITTIAMKSVAYLLTGSISLLSDAVESVVNLLGAMMARSMLTIAAHRMTIMLLDIAKPNISPAA